MDGPDAAAAGTTPSGAWSVARLPDQWFIAARSRDLRRTPMACTVQGVPLVLFRTTSGVPAALVDRCPHRNVPLSAGRVRGEVLECRYHGWRFDTQGACREVPGLCAIADRRARRAASHAVTEQDGFVWVYSTPEATPATAPFRFPCVDDARYTTIRRSFTLPGGLWHALENALDVPHTGFLHAGLFRSGARANEIQVIVRRTDSGAEAEFVGEPRPSGVVGRLLAPGGGVVEHVDRFILPSIAQVEYRLGADNHLLNTTAMTPLADFETRIWAVISLRLRIPSRLVAPLVAPLATRILRQDADILRLQTDTLRRFGGERFTSTEIDVLGPHIWRLLRQAAGGEAGAPGAYEHRLSMRV